MYGKGRDEGGVVNGGRYGEGRDGGGVVKEGTDWEKREGAGKGLNKTRLCL